MTRYAYSPLSNIVRNNVSAYEYVAQLLRSALAVSAPAPVCGASCSVAGVSITTSWLSNTYAMQAKVLGSETSLLPFAMCLSSIFGSVR